MPDTEAKELEVREVRELVSRSSVENPVAAMLKAVIDKGLTAENAEAAKGLYELYKDQAKECAKQAFAASMCLLQAELPTVMATESIPSKDGTIRSRFAPYEEIMAKIGPYLVKYGFSVSFTIHHIPAPADKPGPGRIEAVCKLTHTGGHSETNAFSVRVGSGPPGCSEAQSDGSARSYARRGALCDALNIVVDKDTDAHLEGACIGAQTARSLAERVPEKDRAAFLRLAGADSFATIREHKLPVLEQALREKERAASPEPSPPDPKSQVLAGHRTAIAELCDLGAKKWRTDSDTVLARVTKKVLGDALKLDELNVDQALAVREALETALREKP